MGKVYALSIKQPWAALLVSGRKTIEVRSWATRLRGRVLIHAARVPDARPEAWNWVTDDIRHLTQCGGGIIGEAQLVDCISYPDLKVFTADAEKHLNVAEWFQPRGLYGFVFDRIQEQPFWKVTGNVRFFTVEEPR